MEKTDIAIGHRFGKLTVLREVQSNGSHRRVWVKCDCGAEKALRTSHLRQGTSSCSPICGNARRKHGLSHTRLWDVWKAMKQRCGNPNTASYHRYGGRGISFTPEWQEFEPFSKWALSNGYADHLELDRRDNSQGYSPSNCRFVTHAVNSANRDLTGTITALGKTLTIREWSELTGISLSALRARVFRKWEPDRCVTP